VIGTDHALMTAANLQAGRRDGSHTVFSNVGGRHGWDLAANTLRSTRRGAELLTMTVRP
jgi:hypothetical protein